MQLRDVVRSARILLRTYGLRGIARRSLHETRRSLGWFRASPRVRIGAQPKSGRVRYAPLALHDLPPDRVELAVDRARRVVDGWYEAFGHEWRRFPEGRRGWSTHPGTGFHFGEFEWWKVPHMPAGSDIKDVWEPGRFGWVYDLVRAFALTGDRVYADAFHDQLANWCEANPPFSGVQWACGQETAIRALAVLHGEDALPHGQDDPNAATRIIAVLGSSGERIADAIGYALSQRNNHGLSESAGLVHLGIRLESLHPDAARWISIGAARLEEQIADQFYPDGWYAQHSFSYLRVALEQALLAQRALLATGRTLSDRALSRLASAVRLLELLVDESTGCVPNHGANDGARIAPMSCAEFRDFRPVLTLAALVLQKTLPANVPPDPEVLGWIGGVAPKTHQPPADGVESGDSGWAIARVGRMHVFMRAGTYRHRPSHLDQLHADIREGSDEIIVDAGTFSYNAAPPWNNPFTSAGAHNGPVLDRREPAERGPRFLWYTWPEARLSETSYAAGRAVLTAEVPGRVVRCVNVTGEEVTITDTVLDPAVGQIEVSWLLHPRTRGYIEAEGADLVAAREAEPLGWFSPTYERREPARLVRITKTRSAGDLVIETRVRSAEIA